jgi:hypothetical protein
LIHCLAQLPFDNCIYTLQHSAYRPFTVIKLSIERDEDFDKLAKQICDRHANLNIFALQICDRHDEISAREAKILASLNLGIPTLEEFRAIKAEVVAVGRLREQNKEQYKEGAKQVVRERKALEAAFEAGKEG